MTTLPTYLADPSTTPHSGVGRLVLGTAGLGGAWGKVDPATSVRALLYALEHGVTRLDTAPAYVDAELYVGQALRAWSGNRPFVSTKVGKLRSEAAWISRHDFSPASLRQSVEQSLRTLGVEAVDMLFLHEPTEIAAEQADEVIDTLLRLREQGLTSALGLGGNLNAEWLRRIEAGNFAVAMGFNRLNAISSEALMQEIPLVRQMNTAFHAASPLHMGLLGERLGAFAQQLPPWISAEKLRRAQRLKALADGRGMALPTLAHRFLFSVAEADRVVLGASDLSQVQASLHDWQEGGLPPELFQEIVHLHQTNFR